MSSLEKKKYQEIAIELGISVNTVKSHITKAYRLLLIKTHAEIVNVVLCIAFCSRF